MDVFNKKSDYLDVSFNNFPNRKPVSISETVGSELAERFNNAIIRDSQNTYISVH